MNRVRLSRSGALLLAALTVPVVIEGRTLLAMVGIDVGWPVVLAVGATALAVIALLTFVPPGPQGESAGAAEH